MNHLNPTVVGRGGSVTPFPSLNLLSLVPGHAESQAVPALPAESRPLGGRGRVRLQRLPPQALHAQGNLPHHLPPGR